KLGSLAFRLSSCGIVRTWLSSSGVITRLTYAEHHEMGEREVNRKAHDDRQQLRKQYRDKKGKRKQGRRARNHPGNSRGDEARIVAPAQNASGFRAEGDEGIHCVGTSHGRKQASTLAGINGQYRYV